jgi:hypothetical protein
MHWGTFAGLTDEALDEPPQRLAAALARAKMTAEKFFLMQHGETRLLRRDAKSVAIRQAGSGGMTPR